MSAPNFNLTPFANMDGRVAWSMRKEENVNKYTTVIGKIENLEAWKKLPDVITNSEIATDGGWIVTAELPLDRFEEINQLPFVKDLRMGRIVGRTNIKP